MTRNIFDRRAFLKTTSVAAAAISLKGNIAREIFKPALKNPDKIIF